MVKPVCVPCQRFFRPKRNGQALLEGMPHGPGSGEPGTSSPESWLPYKLWIGDLWECPGCGAQIVVGIIGDRLAEHYETDFKKYLEMYASTLVKVNDC